jgi:hypothetical protein
MKYSYSICSNACELYEQLNNALVSAQRLSEESGTTVAVCAVRKLGQKIKVVEFNDGDPTILVGVEDEDYAELRTFCRNIALAHVSQDLMIRWGMEIARSAGDEVKTAIMAGIARCDLRDMIQSWAEDIVDAERDVEDFFADKMAELFTPASKTGGESSHLANDDNKWFGVVRWTNENIASALVDMGYAPTETNVLEVRVACENDHHFTDRMVEAGWDAINNIIMNLGDCLGD